MPFTKHILQPPFFVVIRNLAGFRLWCAFCFLFCFQVAAPLLAGEKAIKWGNIPRADLEMTTFPDDTNAAAVILADVGEVSYEGRFDMVFSRHRRIKILSPAGYRWGTFAIPFRAKNREQWVADLEGQTFNLAAGGSVQCTRLDKTAIFHEEVDGENHRLRLTFPALSPGCIIEYRYKLYSRGGGFLRQWEFQADEPTRWSEFRANIPEALMYLIIKQGVFTFTIDRKEFLDWPFSLAAAAEAKERNLKIIAHRWAAQNMPALREEPFMTTLEDFRARLRFQLVKIAVPGQQEINVMSNWEALAEVLMESEGFGRQIESYEPWRQQSIALIAGLNDPEQKMRAIYDYMRTTMNWNGDRGLFTNSDLRQVFETRRASSSEIALMLTGMLRSAGLEANPVLISTRNHGKILQAYPILSQFNHALTHVRIGEREYLLDATDPLRPHDLLPVAALNETGWVVDKNRPRWINISQSAALSSQTVVQAKLAEDGSITGWFEATEEGYGGLFERHALRAKGENEYIREKWLEQLACARLDSFKISNRDAINSPLIINVRFSTTDQAQLAQDLAYFNPMLFGRHKQNSFKHGERTFPVDFGYCLKLVYHLNLTLPKGYVVQEMPKNISVMLLNDGGEFRRLAQVEDVPAMGKHLLFSSQIIIRKTRFSPEEYPGLREFYDRIVAAHAEPIVFRNTLQK